MVRKMWKDKRGEMYIQACVVVICLSLLFSLLLYYGFATVLAKEQRNRTRQQLAQYTQNNAVSIYTSIKSQHDHTDTLDATAFLASLAETQGLTADNGELVAYTSSGKVRYRVSDMELRYVVENTTWIQFSYVLTVPLYFSGTAIWVDIPITIDTSLRAKFDT